jgi:hypothetical protein
MNKFLKLIATGVLFVTSAFAQQGLLRIGAPGTVASGSLQSPITTGITAELCPASLLTGGSSLSSCQTSPVSITSDQAGASSITQPFAVQGSGWVQLYAPPGNYALLLNYSFPSDIGNQIIPVNVNADEIGNVALNDGYFYVPPSACGFGSSGGTVTPATANGLLAVGASFLPVLQIATTTATETATLSCVFTVPSRLTAGKGVTVQNIVLAYAPSTGTLASCGTPTLGTITLPTPSTSETASTVTPVSAGGTLTPTPVVASCNATAVTAGQMYSEKVALGTPLSINTDLTDIVFTQAFVGPTTAQLTFYTGGLIVHYSINQI